MLVETSSTNNTLSIHTKLDFHLYKLRFNLYTAR